MSESLEHLQRLRDIYQRQLEILEIDIAIYGLGCPVHLIMQRETIQAKIFFVEYNIEKIKAQHYDERTNWYGNIKIGVSQIGSGLQFIGKGLMRRGLQRFRDISIFISITLIISFIL